MNESLEPNAAAQAGATEPVSEQLSAFVDDALPTVEVSLFARRLQRDEGQLKATMARYLLMGEALRQQERPDAGLTVSRDFSARIAAALEQDQTPIAPLTAARKRRNNSFWRPAAGVAVAAGVTVAVLSAVHLYSSQTHDPAHMASAPVITSKAEAESAAIAAQHAARLANYVLAHSEYSSRLGRANLMTGLLADDAQPGAAAVDTLPAVVGQ